jgi:hypothetical protein
MAQRYRARTWSGAEHSYHARVDRNRYRLLYAAFGLVLVALIALVVVLYPEGDDAGLPEPLEEIFPLPGDSVVRQTAIEIDLPVGYDIDLYVDGRLIPEIEIGFTAATGRWIWQPAPGTSIEQWEGGEHTVVVTWDRIAGGRPDPGEFEWSFRIL